MKLHNVISAAILSSFSLGAIAEDLPNNFLISKSLNPIEVFQVKSATVVKPKVKSDQVDSHGTWTEFSGVLEIVMQVQGNLCTGQAAGVSYLLSPIEKNRSVIRLLVAADNHAYSDIGYACAAYGVFKDTKLAFKVGSSGFESETQPYRQTFTIPTKEAFGPHRQNIDVIVTFTTAGGFKTEIKNAPTVQAN